MPNITSTNTGKKLVTLIKAKTSPHLLISASFPLGDDESATRCLFDLSTILSSENYRELKKCAETLAGASVTFQDQEYLRS